MNVFRLRRPIAVAVTAVVLTAFVGLFLLNPRTSSLVVLVTYAMATLVLASVEFDWRNYAHRNADARRGRRFPKPRDESAGLHKITLIPVARLEKEVIAYTLEILANLDYPRHLYEVLVNLRAGDDETIREARRIEARYPDIIKVHVNQFRDKTVGASKEERKSAQMNAVLPYATGDIVSPVDAESKFAPGILRGIDALVAKTRADVAQGPVQLTNLDIHERLQAVKGKRAEKYLRNSLRYFWSDWFAVHNVMEYRASFGHKMIKQQDLGVMSLGGNTVFIKTDLLRRAGGWDDSRLTEDADLGMRLRADFDAKVVAAYSPELATREQTPLRMLGKRSWFRQRVRWDQGFYQVLRARKWAKLPTLRQRIAGLYILAAPFTQAVNAGMIVIALWSAIFLKAPLPVTVLLYAPFAPMLLTMLTQMLELKAFGQEFGIAPKPRHYVSLVLGFIPYQIMLGIAAIFAFAREVAGIDNWSLTGHSAHLHETQPVTA